MANQSKTDAQAKNLARIYQEARERLLRTITDPQTGVGTKTYANTILNQLQLEIAKLQAETNGYIQSAIPAAYRKSLNETLAYFKRNNLQMQAPSAFASLHSDALYQISREMQFQIGSGFEIVGRQITRYVNEAQDQMLRQAGLFETGVKTASGGTVQDMRKSMVEQLQNEGFMTVQYGSGRGARQVPLDVYASMVARSTTREAGNTARINQLTANGYDLVLMTEHHPTCEMCAIRQGRVYSISGKDLRFPPLSRAFGQYNNIHPNCRHVCTPWVAEMRTEQEIEEAMAKSNRAWTDPRSAEEQQKYNAAQDTARRARNDIYQYERYKQRLGSDAPRSYRTFRRIKKAGGEQWEFMQLDYRRRNRLFNNPELGLPFAEQATIDSRKFTEYIFSQTNPSGRAKGVAFTSRLGYSIDNWQELQSEILRRAPLYPAGLRNENSRGKHYEQFIIIYGNKSKPANVLVGWTLDEDGIHMTSAYIKGVKASEDN